MKKTWPSGVQLTNYLSSFKKSHLLTTHSGLMMKAHRLMVNGRYDDADEHRKKADAIVLYFEKHVDM